MDEKKRVRLRFSIKALIVFVTILAVGLGGWISYSKYKIQKLVELREQGAIVILRDRTPQFLQSIGITRLSPFFDVPTIELYVTPVGNDAHVGFSEILISKSKAEELILEKAAIAKSYGAQDIQLGIIAGAEELQQGVSRGNLNWVKFANENAFTCVFDNKKRYVERLEANQESGANINP